jgi:RES domain-containing protein
MRAWRLVRERHAASAFSGEGAARVGGRWNSHGVRVVYASESVSLAALETLVHLNPPMPLSYVLIPFEFEPEWMDVLAESDLPAGWRAHPPMRASQQVGDAWVARAQSLVLSVPSVIVPGERNYLLNPRHPEISRIRVGRSEPFGFDPRLVPG